MRKFKENILKILLYLSALITVGVLVFIIGFIFVKGYKLIDFNYLFGDYKPSGGGGIKPFIISTLYTIGLSLAIATPIGILAAVYLQEYAKQGRLVKVIRYSTEALSGIPSIVYGLFGEQSQAPKETIQTQTQKSFMKISLFAWYNLR